MANNNIEGMLTGAKEEKEVMQFGDLECRMREDGRAECKRAGDDEFKVFGETPSTLGNPIEDIKASF